MTGDDMTIFEQLHPREDFKSPQEIVVLESRLDELVKDGSIRELSPDGHDVFKAFSRVFVEVESGITFGLAKPDPPFYGKWRKVNVDSFRRRIFKQPWM
jgi:hypothetical protein